MTGRTRFLRNYHDTERRRFIHTRYRRFSPVAGIDPEQRVQGTAPDDGRRKYVTAGDERERSRPLSWSSIPNDE